MRQEAERLRVARELHDGVNQIIASAKMRIKRVVDNNARRLNPAAREILARISERLQKMERQEALPAGQSPQEAAEEARKLAAGQA